MDGKYFFLIFAFCVLFLQQAYYAQHYAEVGCYFLNPSPVYISTVISPTLDTCCGNCSTVHSSSYCMFNEKPGRLQCYCAKSKELSTGSYEITGGCNNPCSDAAGRNLTCQGSGAGEYYLYYSLPDGITTAFFTPLTPAPDRYDIPLFFGTPGSYQLGRGSCFFQKGELAPLDTPQTLQYYLTIRQNAPSGDFATTCQWIGLRRPDNDTGWNFKWEYPYLCDRSVNASFPFSNPSNVSDPSKSCVSLPLRSESNELTITDCNHNCKPLCHVFTEPQNCSSDPTTVNPTTAAITTKTPAATTTESTVNPTTVVVTTKTPAATTTESTVNPTTAVVTTKTPAATTTKSTVKPTTAAITTKTPAATTTESSVNPTTAAVVTTKTPAATTRESTVNPPTAVVTTKPPAATTTESTVKPTTAVVTTKTPAATTKESTVNPTTTAVTAITLAGTTKAYIPNFAEIGCYAISPSPTNLTIQSPTLATCCGNCSALQSSPYCGLMFANSKLQCFCATSKEEQTGSYEIPGGCNNQCSDADGRNLTCQGSGAGDYFLYYSLPDQQPPSGIYGPLVPAPDRSFTQGPSTGPYQTQREVCFGIGGELAILDTPQLLDYYIYLKNNSGFYNKCMWIGLKRPDNDAGFTFKWEYPYLCNTSLNSSTTFSNPSALSDLSKSCVALPDFSVSTQLTIMNCSTPCGWMCQFFTVPQDCGSVINPVTTAQQTSATPHLTTHTPEPNSYERKARREMEEVDYYFSNNLDVNSRLFNLVAGTIAVVIFVSVILCLCLSDLPAVWRDFRNIMIKSIKSFVAGKKPKIEPKPQHAQENVEVEEMKGSLKDPL